MTEKKEVKHWENMAYAEFDDDELKMIKKHVIEGNEWIQIHSVTINYSASAQPELGSIEYPLKYPMRLVRDQYIDKVVDRNSNQ